MTDREKDKRASFRFEIKIRELVLKRLSRPLTLAQSAAEKKRNERLARLDELSEYKTFEEAQDAYGWGYITEEEFESVKSFLEHKEDLKSDRSAEEYAADILQEFVAKLRREISSFRFELLPPTEQKRIQQQQAELLERHRSRRPGAC